MVVQETFQLCFISNYNASDWSYLSPPKLCPQPIALLIELPMNLETQVSLLSKLLGPPHPRLKIRKEPAAVVLKPGLPFR